RYEPAPGRRVCLMHRPTIECSPLSLHAALPISYVTSGLSNPFTVGPGDAFDPEGPSGIGYELVIHTPEEARWPILRLLDMMAYKDRKSTRLNSSHVKISYAVFCSKKKHTQFTQ